MILNLYQLTTFNQLHHLSRHKILVMKKQITSPAQLKCFAVFLLMVLPILFIGPGFGLMQEFRIFWGSAAFCYIHYLLHHKWTRKIMPSHHRFHVYHHCRLTDKCFGVSVTWWDHLFFTAPPKKTQIADRVLDFYYI